MLVVLVVVVLVFVIGHNYTEHIWTRILQQRSQWSAYVRVDRVISMLLHTTYTMNTEKLHEKLSLFRAALHLQHKRELYSIQSTSVVELTRRDCSFLSSSWG